MRKWLRSWFAWRFSLRRLVVATVFLGAVVGLNMRTIGPTKVAFLSAEFWGWPFPLDVRGAELPHPLESKRWVDIETYQVPWTHQTYRLVDSVSWVTSQSVRILCVTIDACVALIPPALILFLQIPRRKVAAKGG